MEDLIYCEPKEVVTTKLSDISDKKVVICKCTGQEKATFIDEDKIPSYSGEIKSPLKIIWVYPNDDVGIIISDKDIRKWVKDACEYHKIPHVLLALILQNENYQNASLFTKIGQFGERSTQTLLKILDKNFEIAYYVKDFPKIVQAIKGSSGIANMSDLALKNGVQHSIENYARPPIPTSIAKGFLDINTDTRISGDDWRSDIYYAASHIRFLIDSLFGNCFDGELSYEMLHRVLRAYNGPAKTSIKYADDAIKNLKKSISGEGVLFFYEK